jgi:ABC-type phosphate transport system substrate-binding protein
MSTRKGIVGRIVVTTMAGLLIAALPGRARAQISIVVAPGSSVTADVDAVARMYSGQVTSWSDGSRVQLVDQSATDVGKSFYDKVLQKGAAQVRKALTALLLSGQIPKPEQGSSDAEVKAAVARLPGSIGYIATSSLDDSVKELVRIP